MSTTQKRDAFFKQLKEEDPSNKVFVYFFCHMYHLVLVVKLYPKLCILMVFILPFHYSIALSATQPIPNGPQVHISYVIIISHVISYMFHSSIWYYDLFRVQWCAQELGCALEVNNNITRVLIHIIHI